ncbi:MAG: hypothetical protein QNJ65_24810, partial [Xenococcaceae cyanobacterium MO_234.B1]|nr:hypothetical protein [Xenococcaceae cyanobacterium MO_234.B1]
MTTPDSHPSDRERASPAHARDFAAPRHLSRQNAPDSPTGLLKGGSKFRPQPLDLTAYFFPPK